VEVSELNHERFDGPVEGIATEASAMPQQRPLAIRTMRAEQLDPVCLEAETQDVAIDRLVDMPAWLRSRTARARQGGVN